MIFLDRNESKSVVDAIIKTTHVKLRKFDNELFRP
jgi:hypothetical protein|tara:strand:+ start:178 stop:282 length:105 start_codon:yes stop_codon:yes gene_type:complete